MIARIAMAPRVVNAKKDHPLDAEIGGATFAYL